MLPVQTLSVCPIILLSEYQIREYGLEIDSVARKHKSLYDRQGTQCFYVNSWVYIDFEDRGGLMGFEMLPIEDGDEDLYDVVTVISLIRWTPHQFMCKNKPHQNIYDPSDTNNETSQNEHSASINHITQVFHVDQFPETHEHPLENFALWFQTNLSWKLWCWQLQLGTELFIRTLILCC